MCGVKVTTMVGDFNFYDDDSREELLEDDEISAEEEGFMKGYEDGV